MVKRKKSKKSSKRKKGKKKLSTERVKPRFTMNDLFVIKCDGEHRFIKASSEYVIQSFLDREHDMQNCRFVGQMADIKKEDKKLYNKLKDKWES